MSKHTPGPWHDWNDPICSVMGARQDGDGGLKAVAILAQWPSEEERAANARLIAAAPDMLAMCSRIISETESPGFLDLYDAYLKVHGEPYRGDMFCMDLRATIAKAKGESE